jgi:hypothetical protein
VVPPADRLDPAAEPVVEVAQALAAEAVAALAAGLANRFADKKHASSVNRQPFPASFAEL